MKVKHIILCSLIALSSVSCKDRSFFESEPNDSFATANPIEPQMDIKGYINNPTDKDVYALTVENESVLDIQVSGVRGVNLAMKIWQGENEPMLMKTIDDNRKSSPERMANIYATPGIYYIELLHGDKDIKIPNIENPYTLRINKRESGIEEIEPNDSYAQANPITGGTEIAGYFSPAYNKMNQDKDHFQREEDWYELNVETESAFPVILDIMLSGVPGINSELFFYDFDLNQISKSDSGERGDKEEIRGIGITKSGKYYIMVSCKNYEVNNDDPYILSVGFREHNAALEMENNDDINHANTIMNNEISGEINHPGDMDFFLYKPIQESGIYRITLSCQEGIDGLMLIYNSRKEKVVDINNSGKGENEIHPDIAVSGEFFIAVSSRIMDKSKANGYSLTVNPMANIEHMELEPNESKTEATRVSGASIKGFISHKADKDFFVLESDGRINGIFTIRGAKGGEIKVSVTDPLGYILKSVSVKGDRTVKLTEMIDKTGYIIVESVLDNYENPYSITIRGR